jgi:branched-chain amino acid aminotransferase
VAVAGAVDFIWMDGEIVPWAEATIHIASDTVLRGESVFEGVRGYWNQEQEELYIFKLAEHLRRLRQSARIMRMAMPYSDAVLTEASVELIKRNGFRSTMHFRPFVYFTEGEGFSLESDPSRIGAFILALRRPRHPKLFTGLRRCTSTWRRNSDLASPSRIKSAANYHNSRLATMEARLNGFDEPIMLNERGKVSESPNACFMLVQNGQVVTPPVTADILESITRSTLIDLFRAELGILVQEREIDRTEVYLADEAFFCGSGSEVQPIVSVDHYELGDGSVGPLTDRIQRLYLDIAEGRVPKYSHWLTPVYQRVAAGAR